MKEVIVLASDHNGVLLKSEIKVFLKEQGYQAVDLGPFTTAVKVDYVDSQGKLSLSLAAEYSNMVLDEEPRAPRAPREDLGTREERAPH